MTAIGFGWRRLFTRWIWRGGISTRASDEGNRVRSFVALPLPERIQAALFAAAGELARELPDVKWSRKAENLHVTIKFLGGVEEERLAEVGAALGAALATVPRFSVAVGGAGAFPSAGKANVIWIGAGDGDGRLAEVARLVEAVTAGLGVGEREARPFRGHVTLGRVKGRGVDARRALDGSASAPSGPSR